MAPGRACVSRPKETVILTWKHIHRQNVVHKSDGYWNTQDMQIIVDTYWSLADGRWSLPWDQPRRNGTREERFLPRICWWLVCRFMYRNILWPFTATRVQPTDSEPRRLRDIDFSFSHRRFVSFVFCFLPAVFPVDAAASSSCLILLIRRSEIGERNWTICFFERSFETGSAHLNVIGRILRLARCRLSVSINSFSGSRFDKFKVLYKSQTVREIIEL